MPSDVWGGLECTVNRVGSDFFDQVCRTGHHWRIADLEQFAKVGFSKLRYPVLWERTAPHGTPDWNWPTTRLNKLRDLGIDPIVGLLHHGSGPSCTSLIDPEFPRRFSQYARAVAERFPWVEHYTPINEPLTTARFSTLYGHWYPHACDTRMFLRAVFVQCRAVALAMQEIRKVNPAAKLIQTEDLGKVFAVPNLQYQADFENHRRWLTFDLLCGHVDQQHPLWKFILGCGVTRGELAWFQENPCAPDIIGMNHYVTSDRFLDDRLEHYPPGVHGTNGRHRYADVEAVRVNISAPLGPEARLREICQRYDCAVALTEVHIGCTIDEQIRWFCEAWNAASQLQREGADIRGVTAWALLGSYDWNSLLTRQDGVYESGVFDLRGGNLQPTELAGVIRQIARGCEPEHPALEDTGWWRKSESACYLPSADTCDNVCAI
jgi:dTDP-4-dehydrorhamnose reductase